MFEEPKCPQDALEGAVSDQSRADVGAKGGYEVGYGKPPKASRFSKGRSGNPRGRKKKSEIADVRTVIEAVLEEPIKLRDGDKSRSATKLEAMLLVQRMKALKGDPKAVKAFFRLAQKTGLFSQAKWKSLMVLHDPGDPEEQMILKAFHATQEPRTKLGDE
jgi:hypothetical protein